MFYRAVINLALGSVLLCCLGHVQAQQKDDAERELAALQAELKSRQQALIDNRTSAEELQAVLAESEKQIGEAAKRLNDTEQTLLQNKQEQTQLQRRQSELKEAIMQQQSMLAGQLKSAFVAGHYDYAKMIFYQQDAAKFERIITYYQYLNQARQQNISQFKDTAKALDAVTLTLQQNAKELVSLLEQQGKQRNELVTRQQDRKQTLAKLNAKIASDEMRISRLREAEQALVEAIERAQRMGQIPQELTGLKADKGHLLKPATGSVRKLFGRRRQGQVRWKGIMIDGREGSAVKTIAHGRVVYADWLRGFGLVTIIEHGDGFMTVYGHNQALLRQAGESVAKGETVALLGQSGGQNSPNLYFEIRHKGKAVDPADWLDL